MSPAHVPSASVSRSPARQSAGMPCTRMPCARSRRERHAAAWLLAGLFGLALTGPVAAMTPRERLEALSAQAGRPADATRGRAFFTGTHGHEWSCASCHGERPTTTGRHAGTGKAIEPLAPAANAARFTDDRKVEKWFRRNCRDVVGRECSAAEQADVLAWLISLPR